MIASPSALHAKAAQRSPRHDAMQNEFLAFLQTRVIVNPGGPNLLHRRVEVELPIIVNGGIRSFADVAEIWDFATGRVVNLYEIKPRIESVGGIIRQCKHMQNLAEQSTDLNAAIVSCAAVVPWNDPAIEELKQAFRFVWAWGVEFTDGATP